MIRDISEVSWSGWETVGVLGRGSFGAVYEIHRDVLGETEKAALKVISIPQSESEIQELYNDGYDNESVAETFQAQLKSIVNEYSMMRRMNDCANVVHCDDVRYEQKPDGIGWDIYIKMELLTPLAQALPEVIPEETVIQVGKDICNALTVCAKHNIVHRDIKPQNMFVSPGGSYKLGDFGVARTMERTMGGTKIGTFKYMAPEVYHSNPYGAAADIYSLGLVLYWMLNYRRMPFMPLPPAKVLAGMDGDAANRRLAGEQIPPPAKGSEELKRIVLKACAFDAKDRYKSAEEMLAALDNIGKNPKSVARPVYNQSEPAHNPESAVRARSAQTNPNSTYRVRQAPVQNAPASKPAAAPVPEPPAKSKKGILIVSIVLILLLIIGGIVIGNMLNSNIGTDENDPAMSAADNAENPQNPQNYDDPNEITDDFSNVDYSNAKVGDIITFGSYEQDNKSSNGKESIEWQVLEIKDGKALLISKYAIDCQSYNTNNISYEDITWETCSLRKWLNEDFLNAAFTLGERMRIPTVTVSADGNLDEYTSQGEATQDQVFLLSISEAETYLDSFYKKICIATKYAEAQGAWTYHSASSYDTPNNLQGRCWWWLRSPGFRGASYVGTTGDINENSDGVPNENFAVRPAVWIILDPPQLNSIQESTTDSSPQNINAGNTIVFGNYEQDNDLSNGKEPIEWQVLEVQDGKALVISKYALDCQPYNTEYDNVTWETCTLRSWLNDDFLKAAFTTGEQTRIPTVTVSADKNPSYDTNPGKATQDKVFLLSINEADQYFSSDDARSCEPTAYAIAQGCWTYDDTSSSYHGNCWWLRSPGYYRNFAASVKRGGWVGAYGNYVIDSDNAVRPALWIDLNGL